jgi:hypothetical protein
VKLADYVDALSYEAAFALAALTNPKAAIGALGAASVQACAKLRTLAIIAGHRGRPPHLHAQPGAQRTLSPG